jgi:hypothetical protein
MQVPNKPLHLQFHMEEALLKNNHPRDATFIDNIRLLGKRRQFFFSPVKIDYVFRYHIKLWAGRWATLWSVSASFLQLSH